MLRFGHLERTVRDTATARDFYVDALGFTRVADQGPDFYWVGLGDVEILLRRGPGAPAADGYADGGGIVLYCEDVPAEVARLAALGIPMQGDDGALNPTFTDPDGHWFQLANPGPV